MVVLEKRGNLSWLTEESGRQGPSGSELVIPVSRAEIEEYRCLGIGQC